MNLILNGEIGFAPPSDMDRTESFLALHVGQ